jgi:hypothetical protein
MTDLTHVFDQYMTEGHAHAVQAAMLNTRDDPGRGQARVNLPWSDAVNFIGHQTGIDAPDSTDMSRVFAGGFSGQLTSSPKIPEGLKLRTPPVRPYHFP